MFEITLNTTSSKRDFYDSLAEQLSSLLEGERDFICNAAQFSAFLMQTISDLNWAGFYIARDQSLILGPFVGKVACTRIDINRGVCGAAAKTKQTQRVDNVHEFSGHITCDSQTLSELVIPVIVDNDLIGVLDLDSPIENRFTEEDQFGIETLLTIFIKQTDFEWQL